MKKIFTLITMAILALSAQAAITIHVESEEAPYIWAWGAKDAAGADVDLSELFPDGSWPGTQVFKGKATTEDGTEFWTYTFPENIATISFLFNNGQAEGTKQTKDFNGVTTDRYFTLTWDDGDGNVVCEDISEAYVEIPDAEVKSVILVGNHNNWGNKYDDGTVPEVYNFEVVESGKTFSITMDLTNLSVEENMWQFKFRPNASEWIGYWDFYYELDPVEGRVSVEEAPAWLQEKGGNFMIDFEETVARIFKFTITWGGGKEAGANWSIKAEIADPASINTMKANNNTTVRYNLQGQRIKDLYRGLVIQNGKKVMVK